MKKYIYLYIYIDHFNITIATIITTIQIAQIDVFFFVVSCSFVLVLVTPKIAIANALIKHKSNMRQ